MLAPKKVKFRKWQKGRLRGLASRGASIAFGDIGLKAVQHGQLSSQQIEAARIAMMRQGSGKGAPVGWCAPVKPGRVLYEIKGVSIELAKEALTRAAHKLPIKTVIVVKEGI